MADFNTNTMTHRRMVRGTMEMIDKAHAWTGRISAVRTTQSADNESPIAEALAMAYIWRRVTTSGGHASGKLAAAAEIMAEFQAI